MIHKLPLLGVALAAFVAAEAQATLVTNGTFDTDLSGWDASGSTTGVTWVAGAANVGQFGTPGVAIFEQKIDIPAGTPAVKISFDYEWQLTPPALDDTFSVTFDYAGGSADTFLMQPSSAATFNSTIPYSTTLALLGLSSGLENGTITFTLNEVNSGTGTRVRLDNVSVVAVPEAGALAVWSLLSGVGLVSMRRRKRDAGQE